ncbi:sulfite exporter TauE/SafE family protein [Agromyces bauzanensis]
MTVAASFVLIWLAVLAGGFAQRVVGLGFGLVVSPFLILLIDPRASVLVINLIGAISAATVLTRVWRDVDWRAFSWLVIPACLGVVPGILLASVIDADVLRLLIGLIVFAALTASLLVTRSELVVRGDGARVVTGLLSGVLNSGAGVGGPTVSIYAVLSRWEQRSFAATLQPFFVTLSTVTIIAKRTMTPAEAPDWSWWAWGLLIGAMLLGVAVGDRLARHISARAARIGVIAFAYTGALTAIAFAVAGLTTR